MSLRTVRYGALVVRAMEHGIPVVLGARPICQVADTRIQRVAIPVPHFLPLGPGADEGSGDKPVNLMRRLRAILAQRD